MKERQEDLRGLLKEHRQIMTGLSVLILLSVAAVVMMCLTKDKAEHISSGEVQREQDNGPAEEVVSMRLLRENLGCLAMEANPLAEASEEGLKRRLRSIMRNWPDMQILWTATTISAFIRSLGNTRELILHLSVMI